MDASIKPINDKVSMFASDAELEDKLTKQELMLIKLVKLEEFANDLYRSTQSDYHAEFNYNKNFKYKGQSINILVWNKDYKPWRK
jgi:hypothetical protein